MDINKMTIGDFKEIQGFFNNGVKSNKSNLLDNYQGKYVICRSRNEGINAGVVVKADETGIILADARRLYYHKPLDKKVSWYEGVALKGLSSESKVGAPVEKVIVEDYSITLCSKKAEKSIREIKTNEQS